MLLPWFNMSRSTPAALLDPCRDAIHHRRGSVEIAQQAGVSRASNCLRNGHGVFARRIRLVGRRIQANEREGHFGELIDVFVSDIPKVGDKRRT